MSKRALVIGSEVHGLTGVHNDVEAVTAAFTRRGFVVDTRIEGRASRAGILEGYRALAEASAPGDAAVVYYSGHGQLARNKDPDPTQRRWFQGIVPTDFYDLTGDDDYRGISAWEMSFNLELLTQKTRNVTVLLDCCHSSQMSRDGLHHRAKVRAIEKPVWTDFGPHIAALRRLYPTAADVLTAGWSNPHAVRLVACAQAEAAHEYRTANGAVRGAFTEVVLRLLEEAEDGSISWNALGRAVRERVQRIFPTQRPELEGPSHRRLFSLVEEDGSGAVPLVTSRDQRHLLRAGRLAGVSVGDVYSVLPLGASRLDDEAEIARVTVTSSTATAAEVQLEQWCNGKTALPEDAVALPRQRAAPRRPVAVIAPPPALPELERALAATRSLRLAAREGDQQEAPLATLRLEGEQLFVEDAHGPLAAPLIYPRQLADAVQYLVDLGVAQGLRELEGEHGISERNELSMELCLVDAGQLRPLAHRGARLGPGDLVALRLTCRAQRRLYVHVFNLGVQGRLSRVTEPQPSGISLNRGEYYTLGESDATTELEGMEVSWPAGLPADRPRLDELVVIVTTKAADLSALSSRPPRQESEVIQRNPGASALEELLAQLQDGLPRDIVRREVDPFLLKRLSYFLEPQAVLRDGNGAELPLDADGDGREDQPIAIPTNEPR